MDGWFAKEVVSKECDTLSWFATLLVAPLTDVGVKGEGFRVWRVGTGKKTFEFVWPRARRRNNEIQSVPLACSILFWFVVAWIVMVIGRLETRKT